MYNCGLVLEGGGNRAIYTSGVLDAFLENGIDFFPYVIGVSAGACNAASFISKNRKRHHDIIVNYCNDKRYMGVNSLLTTGEIVNYNWLFGDIVYNLVPIDIETYDKSETVFCSVVINAKTGEGEYLYPKGYKKNVNDAIRASAALPFFTKGVKIGGNRYFDGGVVDSIPLEKAYKDGCKKCIVIMTQHDGFVKPQFKRPAMIKFGLSRYPKLAAKTLERCNVYNRQTKYIKEEQAKGRAFVIQPESSLDCPTLEKDPQKLEAIYQMGYKQGLENIEKVKEFLKD